MKKLSKQEIP